MSVEPLFQTTICRLGIQFPTYQADVAHAGANRSPLRAHCPVSFISASVARNKRG